MFFGLMRPIIGTKVVAKTLIDPSVVSPPPPPWVEVTNKNIDSKEQPQSYDSNFTAVLLRKGYNKSQSHVHLTVFCVALSYNRPPPSVGRLTGTCRSKSYHHMARNPPSCGSGRIHTEPTSRRTVRSIYPVTAPGYGVRQGHATRYIIVNEHAPRRKLLHSATRIPRHYLIAEPPEILELYPHNAECFTPQNIKCQQRSHRPHISHLTQEWEDEEHLKHKRRPQDHRFLGDHQSHFYSENHIKNQGSKGRHNNTRRYGKAKQDEGGTDDLASEFRTSVEEDGPQMCSVDQSPVRPRPLKTTKIRTKPVTPQTESDSASLGSSSDQHNSSTDQYIQVIHNRSDVAQKRSKGSLFLNLAESHDLVCSNV